MKHCRTCNKELLPTCNRFCTMRCMRKAPKREWAGTKFGCYTIISFHSIINHRRTYLCTNHKGDERIVSSDDLMHAKTNTSEHHRKNRRVNYHQHNAHYINYRKKYRKNNPQVEKDHLAARHKFANYKREDTKRNMEFNYTYEELLYRLATERCVYCGSIYNLGLDRINNSKGHTKSNTVIACYRCNSTRMDNFTVDEMKQIGKVIREIDKRRSNI